MTSHLVVSNGHIETNVPRSAARAIFRCNRENDDVRTYTVTVEAVDSSRVTFVTANGLRIVTGGSR